MGAFKVDVGIDQPWRQKLVVQRVGLMCVVAAAARMDDVVAVVTSAESVKAASLVLRQTVVRDGETLVTALAQCAYLRDGRPARIPERMRQEMMRTE